MPTEPGRTIAERAAHRRRLLAERYPGMKIPTQHQMERQIAAEEERDGRDD